MTVKDAMSRLKHSFAYERFQKAMSRVPPNIGEARKAIVVLDKEEHDLLRPVYISVCKNNFSLKLSPHDEEKIRVLVEESKTLESVGEAADRWRKELMPDWHEIKEDIRKLRQDDSVEQAQV